MLIVRCVFGCLAGLIVNGCRRDVPAVSDGRPPQIAAIESALKKYGDDPQQDVFVYANPDIYKSPGYCQIVARGKREVMGFIIQEMPAQLAEGTIVNPLNPGGAHRTTLELRNRGVDVPIEWDLVDGNGCASNRTDRFVHFEMTSNSIPVLARVCHEVFTGLCAVAADYEVKVSLKDVYKLRKK